VAVVKIDRCRSSVDLSNLKLPIKKALELYIPNSIGKSDDYIVSPTVWLAIAIIAQSNCLHFILAHISGELVNDVPAVS